MIVNSNQFSYDATANSFIAEMSTLSRGGKNCFSQIYPDAADEGLEMISHLTGRSAKFAVETTEHDGESELVAWHLVPTAETVRKNPGLRGSTVTIFND